ncbi:MAG: hypothetical protein AAFX06_25245 [Planctomycetota bacterium]
MINPYEAPADASPKRARISAALFAGIWLLVAGLSHAFVANYFAGTLAIERFNYSTFALLIPGVMALTRIPVLLSMLQFLLWFGIAVFAAVTVFTIAGVYDGTDLSDALNLGPVKLDDPIEIVLALSSVAIAVLPPWLALCLGKEQTDSTTPSD